MQNERASRPSVFDLNQENHRRDLQQLTLLLRFHASFCTARPDPEHRRTVCDLCILPEIQSNSRRFGRASDVLHVPTCSSGDMLPVQRHESGAYAGKTSLAAIRDLLYNKNDFDCFSKSLSSCVTPSAQTKVMRQFKPKTARSLSARHETEVDAFKNSRKRRVPDLRPFSLNSKTCLIWFCEGLWLVLLSAPCEFPVECPIINQNILPCNSLRINHFSCGKRFHVVVV